MPIKRCCFIAFLVLVTSSCGYRGALYLPEQPAPTETPQSSEEQQLSQPENSGDTE